MKAKEVRELSIEEIEKKIRDTSDELLQIRLKKQTGQIETPHQLRQLRRNIARLETILVEKKVATLKVA
jgi:large subunit ribosomal protein L29